MAFLKGPLLLFMNKNLRYLLASFLAFPSTHLFAQSNPVAPALNFNVFLQNGFNVQNNETEGPVAMGGNLTISGGYQVSTNYTGTFKVSGVKVTLVVGGKVNYTSGTLQVNQNGYIKLGNCSGSTVWYKDNNGAYSPMRITPGSDYNGSPRILLQAASNTLGVSASVNPVCDSGIIDFASAFAQLRANSDSMSHLTDNAYITTSGGTVITPHSSLPTQVKITLAAGINVLNLSGTDLSAMTDFVFNNKPDATHVLIVNVNAPGSYTWKVYNSGGIGLSECKYILYNFYNTTALAIEGSGAIEGTVFAPRADITKTVNKSNIEGQIIAKSYYHNGGENHYPVFNASVPKVTSISAPVAAFTVSDTLKCLSGNSFSFTNGSTGSSLTYSWNFGDATTSTAANPTKTYSSTGTYTVKLVVTNGSGIKDSTTRNVRVATTPSYGFAVNDTTQALTGNNFIFTTLDTTGVLSYSWTFGDTGLGSTSVNPSKTYASAGTYTVTQNITGRSGCKMSASLPVIVESDGVGSGTGGGLESSSLGDLVSRREFSKIRNSISTRVDYSAMASFYAPLPYARTTGNSSILQQLLPASLENTEAKVSSPIDLKTLTAAVDVLSVDYVRDNKAKAVALAITTLDKPYNHTKSICDRFRGATLLSTEQVSIKGFDFIRFALKQNNGQVEYSFAFAAGKSKDRGTFKLQTNWLISAYSGDDSVFNFQVWANTPDKANKLAETILNNLSAIMPLQQDAGSVSVPQAYILYGRRNKEYLNIAVNSSIKSGNAKLVLEQRINELSGVDLIEIPFNFEQGTGNTFSIPIKDGYEYEGHLYVNDQLTDDVYIADGNWSLDYDKNYTSITSYKPNNNFDRVYTDGEYPVYRSISVKGTSSDYLSVYKFLAPGEEKVDLSGYQSFRFYAKGSGQVEIRLIKDSVVKWADQYKNVVTLDPAGKNYAISFEDFTSDRLQTAFNPNDVKAIVYTFLFNGVPTEFSFLADEQSFSPERVTSLKALASKKLTVTPNPVSEQFEIRFASDVERDMDLTVTTITGAMIYKVPVHATIGNNIVSIHLGSIAGTVPPSSVLFIKLGSKDVKYTTEKVLLNN